MFSPKGMVSHIKKSIYGGKLHYVPINSKFQYCPPPHTHMCPRGREFEHKLSSPFSEEYNCFFYVEVSEGKEFTFVSRWMSTRKSWSLILPFTKNWPLSLALGLGCPGGMLKLQTDWSITCLRWGWIEM